MLCTETVCSSRGRSVGLVSVGEVPDVKMCRLEDERGNTKLKIPESL